jgi:hypothetical protein
VQRATIKVYPTLILKNPRIAFLDAIATMINLTNKQTSHARLLEVILGGSLIGS